MANRTNLQAFQAAVNGAGGLSGKFNYSAVLNTDNISLKISQTPKTGGAAVVLFSSVLWNVGGPGTTTDANPSQDSVAIFAADGAGVVNVADAQQFLNNLP